MNNETFGITFQYAICETYFLENDIANNRTDDNLIKNSFKKDFVEGIFQEIGKPKKFLTTSREYTSKYIKKCPHNFLLENEKTFSIRTFKGKGKMFAPKVVGQAGDDTFNHFFGHLSPKKITRKNFKQFCLSKINEILPIVVDYALISDYNCWFYKENGVFTYKILKREDLPDLTYEKKYFTFTNSTVKKWNESNTVKYKGKTILELQLHTNRTGFKIRLHRENFSELLKIEKAVNNSQLGDTAELAICKIFCLESGVNDRRLNNNSDKNILKIFQKHYSINKSKLFQQKPIKYSGTDRRERGVHSKSGVDFYLENNNTLSLKTNKSKSYKVCPPEVGQPSPKTFDLHFADKGWYTGNINEEKFRLLVKDKNKLALLLKEYVKFLNECDFLLWSLYLNKSNITSILINKEELEHIDFEPELINYSNDFLEKSSVTIKYGNPNSISLGEFQIHSARNSLKFRFNFGNLLSFK